MCRVWQLLARPKSLEEFNSLPFLSSHFFQADRLIIPSSTRATVYQDYLKRKGAQVVFIEENLPLGEISITQLVLGPIHPPPPQEPGFWSSHYRLYWPNPGSKFARSDHSVPLLFPIPTTYDNHFVICYLGCQTIYLNLGVVGGFAGVTGLSSPAEVAPGNLGDFFLLFSRISSINLQGFPSDTRREGRGESCWPIIEYSPHRRFSLAWINPVTKEHQKYIIRSRVGWQGSVPYFCPIGQTLSRTGGILATHGCRSSEDGMLPFLLRLP